MRTRFLGLVALVLLIGLAVAVASHDGSGPRYDAKGNLLFPDDFETWVFVGSSLGLTYADTPPSHDMFHNVYLDRRAYEHYVETGRFPDETMLAMTLYAADEKSDFGSGQFSGELHGLEVAVKDGDWSYYDFGGFGGMEQVSETSRAQPRSSCHDCHEEHARKDNVFVQFYPVLRRLEQSAR